MIFTINKNEFLNALTIVAKGTSTRSTLPVLSGVHIKAEGASLTFQTTDLERSIRYDVTALIDEPGQTVVPEKLLQEIVKNLPDAAVEFKAESGSVSVSCDAASFVLKALDPQDFPAFPQVDVESRIKVPFTEFCSMVKKVARAVSKDQGSGAKAGVLIVTDEGVLRMVATDSYRAAVAEVEIPDVQEGFEAVVAGNFLQEVASLPHLDEVIEIGLSDNQVVFEFKTMVLVNRRLEGEFPDYRRILPTTFETKTCFSTAELITAVRRVGLVGSALSSVKLDINKDTGDTSVSSVSKDVGSAVEVVPCEVTGENIQIGFNRQYLLDGLMAVSTPQVFLETQESLRPGVFRSGEGESFLYVVMPVRIMSDTF